MYAKKALENCQVSSRPLQRKAITPMFPAAQPSQSPAWPRARHSWKRPPDQPAAPGFASESGAPCAQDRQRVLLAGRTAPHQAPVGAQEGNEGEADRLGRRIAPPPAGVKDLLGAGRRAPERPIHGSPAVQMEAPNEQSPVDIVEDRQGLGRVGSGAPGAIDAPLPVEPLLDRDMVAQV